MHESSNTLGWSCVLADSVFETKVEDQVDYVRAYFGMRKVSLGHVGGEKSLRILLNDKFVFHIGMLDQVRHSPLNSIHNSFIHNSFIHSFIHSNSFIQ